MPADVLRRLLASDPGRPRLTWYDDEPGPTAGERIELSARVLANWVAKAGNLLQDDAAAGPGTTVGLDLPTHWRTAYWALATWSVGATVVVGTDALVADLLVTDSPQRAAGHHGDAVLVTLPALARRHPGAAEAGGAVDEARELPSHGDRFTPLSEPEPGDVALSGDGVDTAYDALVVARPEWGPAPRVAVQAPPATALVQSLSAWAADGSVVMLRGPRAAHAGRLEAEGVTVDLR
ncbi:MAG TPA: TIGR03089 family protein [Intrasporangium sp.]|uniref:TIGR03089 family protein n=1 Tax=Intrasporangium sp. TaxID=1925024 RepID=UPI002D7738EE|nr:TIGR03089 family protein [Intrasporangium sp.]HET7399719.1 TIGR03089 family protein [Intrasporangium sp.]